MNFTYEQLVLEEMMKRFLELYNDYDLLDDSDFEKTIIEILKRRPEKQSIANAWDSSIGKFHKRKTEILVDKNEITLFKEIMNNFKNFVMKVNNAITFFENNYKLVSFENIIEIIKYINTIGDMPPLNTKELFNFSGDIGSLILYLRRSLLNIYFVEGLTETINSTINKEATVMGIDLVPYKDYIPLIFKHEAVSSDLKEMSMHALKQRSDYKDDWPGYRKLSNYYMVYKVEPITDLARSILQIEPKHDPISEIPSIMLTPWISLTHLFKTMMVNFNIVYGSFDRIKSCPFCGKLSFEKKKNYLKHCRSSQCKKIAYQKSEPEGMAQCRDTQNAWMRNRVDDMSNIDQKYSYVYGQKFNIDNINDDDFIFIQELKKIVYKIINTIKKRDCQNCTDFIPSEGEPIFPDGGKCKILKPKNEKFMEICSKVDFRKLKKYIKSIYNK